MRPGRELDCEIAQQVFGRKVFVKKKVLHEITEHGDRPLRRYSKDMDGAWEVAVKMGVSLLPIEGSQWFAIVGSTEGWRSPAEFIQFITGANFMKSGAAVAETAPLAICLAAMRALESRRVEGAGSNATELSNTTLQ